MKIRMPFSRKASKAKVSKPSKKMVRQSSFKKHNSRARSQPITSVKELIAEREKGSKLNSGTVVVSTKHNSHSSKHKHKNKDSEKSESPKSSKSSTTTSSSAPNHPPLPPAPCTSLKIYNHYTTSHLTSTSAHLTIHNETILCATLRRISSPTCWALELHLHDNITCVEQIFLVTLTGDNFDRFTEGEVMEMEGGSVGVWFGGWKGCVRRGRIEVRVKRGMVEVRK